MKKLLNIALGIGFCLMFCFLAVGYAALNDELHVTGSVSYQYVDSTEPTLPDSGTDGTGSEVDYGLMVGFGSRAGNAKMVDFGLQKLDDGRYAATFLFTSEYFTNLDEDYYKMFISCAIPGFHGLEGASKGKQLYIQFEKDGETKLESHFSGHQEFKDVTIQPGVSYSVYISGVDFALGEKSTVTWTIDPDVTENSRSYEIDTTAVTNLTIESQEAQTMGLSSRPNLLLTLTPAEGYLLPETFSVTIGGTEYAISTAGENEIETMLWEAETNTLYILGDILPTDGNPVVVTAHAVPELPGFTLNTDGLLHLTAQWHTANGCLNLSLTAEDGYLLPESLVVTINNVPYTVYTTPEGENPAGMGYDPVGNILTIHFSLIPQNAQIALTAEAIPEPVEEETEPTKEVTDPTEETTEPTGETTDSV